MVENSQGSSRSRWLYHDAEDDDIKEQERLLPMANVGRIMKQKLPENAKISKEAKETMQECVSEFIGFVTGEASDKCKKERRKTINGDDICSALQTLGFDDYAGALKQYLNRYREHMELGATSTSNNTHHHHHQNKAAAAGTYVTRQESSVSTTPPPQN